MSGGILGRTSDLQFTGCGFESWPGATHGRELHGDGDDGTTAVTTVLPRLQGLIL